MPVATVYFSLDMLLIAGCLMHVRFTQTECKSCDVGDSCDTTQFT